ncbi:MAG: T9SS type A sorting domain-containing protein [Bacteroidia bacterium]|nr:T9SS type A sorting domain-containing protein [Bacteroidia bacterium]
MKLINLLLALLVAQAVFATCRVDTLNTYTFITGTSVKEKAGRQIYSYDANNNRTQYVYQKWNSGSSAWVNSSKYDYTYDANNNQTQELRQTWNSGSSNWVNNSKNTYEYNTNGDRIAEDGYSSWVDASSYYADHVRNEYICTQINTGIGDMAELAFKLYPNPVTNNRFTIQATQSGTYFLNDMQGRTIQQGTIVIGENNINIPSLQAGIYVVKINNKIFKLVVE